MIWEKCTLLSRMEIAWQNSRSFVMNLNHLLSRVVQECWYKEFINEQRCMLLNTCHLVRVTWYQIPQNWHLITDIYYLVPLQDRYILPDTCNNQILNMWYSLPLPKRRFQYLIPETSQACYLTHDFKAKARFLDICTESQDTGQNMSNFAGLVWKTDSLHVFGNIMRLAAYFLKPISALNSWVWAGRFEYHEPYNPNKFFFTFDSHSKTEPKPEMLSAVLTRNRICCCGKMYATL